MPDGLTIRLFFRYFHSVCFLQLIEKHSLLFNTCTPFDLFLVEDCVGML